MKTAALALACLSLLSHNAFAQKLAPDVSVEHFDGSMRFSAFKPCSGTASLCAVQILAEGNIEMESTAKLDQFLRSKANPANPSEALPLSPKISFDSAGGSITGAMQLGRYIRANRLNTNLESGYARISPDRANPADRAETFVSSARCNTSCMFAFAGGVARSVDAESKMALQQIPRIPIKNVVGGPIIPGASELSIYLRDMGVRTELLNVAALAAPGSVVWLSEPQLAQTRMDNSQPYASPWALIDSGTGTPVVSVRQEINNAQNVSLMLGYHEGKLVVITTTELNRTLFDDARIQLFPVGGKPQISLRTDKQAIPVIPTRTWARNDSDANAVFVAVGTISESDAKALASALTLKLEDDQPKDLADMSGSVDLSTENLQPTLALLLRSK